MKLGTRVFLEKLEESQEFCSSQFDVLEIQDFVMPGNLENQVDSLHNKYQELLRDFKGELTIHGPYMDLNPISMDEDIKKITFKRYQQSIEVAKRFNAKWVVIHSYFSQIHNQESWYQDYWVEENILFWEEFIPILEQEKITVVLENIFDVNPQTMKRLIKNIDCQFFKVCLDVGHAHVFSKDTLKNWIEVLGEDLKYLHISDNDGMKDSHLPIGHGTIDFQQIVASLPTTKENLIVISESFCSPEEEKEGLVKTLVEMK